MEIDALFGRFDEQAPAYLAEHPNNRTAVNMALGTLRHVLLGETGTREGPAKVTV